MKRLAPIRLTPFQTGLECHVNVNKIKAGLKANGFAPGDDDKYSLNQMFIALRSPTGLEQKAKEAKYRQIIDNAETARLEKLEKKGKLVPAELLDAYVSDYSLQLAQFIRHSALPPSEKNKFWNNWQF